MLAETPPDSTGSRVGQREDVGCRPALTKFSVNLIRSWGAGMAHQSWFKSIPRSWAFLHPNQSATECRLPLESGQAAGFSLRLLQQRD